MAQQTATSVASLRAATFRLSTTSPDQLPKVASQVAASVWNCKDVLSASADSKQAKDASSVVNRFKTQLTTLLQDRTVEGRWAAVVLVKAAVEAGGLELLGKSNTWVKNLLGFLKRPDPPTTRNLAVLTLTRIFMLTWDYSNLVREITTPAMTTFVPTCIANIENKRCSASELQTILEAFALLLPRHPTIFRTHETRFRAYLVEVVSSSDSRTKEALYYTETHQAMARRLLVLLHGCAPKQGAAEAWRGMLQHVVITAHSTCDRIFRAINEDWQSAVGIEASVPAHLLAKGDPAVDVADELGFLPWTGINAGGERLVTLLHLLEAHIIYATSHTVSLRLGLIVDLLTRLLDIAMPYTTKQASSNFNNQVSRDEREALFAVLPAVHVATARVFSTLMDRLGAKAAAIMQPLTEEALRVFESERMIHTVRSSFYQLFTRVVDLNGPSMSKSECLDLEHVFRSCCEDVLPRANISQIAQTAKASAPPDGIKQQLGMNDSTTSPRHSAELPELANEATLLLRTALRRLDASCISPKIRAHIDRAATLTSSKKLLLASVMNPPKAPNKGTHQASLLPIMARRCGTSGAAEALLRPRMPTISTSKRNQQPIGGSSASDEEDDEESEVESQGEDGNESEQMDVAEAMNTQAEQNLPSASLVEEDMSATQLADELAMAPSGKRRAAEQGEDESAAKRLRASPVALSLVSDTTQALPRPESTSTSVPVDEADAKRDKSKAEIAIQSRGLPTTTTAPGGQVALVEQDSDDSDFEMPPLTMEPDTDPEDEGEE